MKTLTFCDFNVIMGLLSRYHDPNKNGTSGPYVAGKRAIGGPHIASKRAVCVCVCVCNVVKRKNNKL
jgi:hypothetical protein